MQRSVSPALGLDRRMPERWGILAAGVMCTGLALGPASADTPSHCGDTIHFTDHERDSVEITRCVLPPLLVNQIVLRHPNGRTETRTVTTTLDSDGVYTVSETVASSDSPPVSVTRQFGTALGRGRGGGRPDNDRGMAQLAGRLGRGSR